MREVADNQAKVMCQASGDYSQADPFVEFLYILLRDYLRFGAIEDIIIKDISPLGEGDHVEKFMEVLCMYISSFQIAEIKETVTGNEVLYANGWVARYCQYTAKRLRGVL
jgi:hypothetical protein